MKKKFLFLLLLFPLSLFSQTIDTLSVYSKDFQQNRKILIYLPAEYQLKDHKFEVAYVFDSQARMYFDCVHSSIGFLQTGINPMIVVGVVSENRNKEFLPENKFEQTAKDYWGNLGDANKLMSFLSNDLIPYIDKNYRTLPRRMAIGHSNGGTFICYCLTQKPEIFDAYVAISPNFAYDNEQMVSRFSAFDPKNIPDSKYLYMCNSNEDSSWVAARNKVIGIFKSNKFTGKIHFENQSFADSENHGTVFPTGVFSGLKNYFNYKFSDVEGLIEYYKNLQNKGFLELNAEMINNAGYAMFYGYNQKEGGIKMLLWGNQLFPDDLNLYDSLGEFYQNSGQKDTAMKYYQLFKSKLIGRKNKLSSEEYNRLMSGIESRIDYLKNHM